MILTEHNEVDNESRRQPAVSIPRCTRSARTQPSSMPSVMVVQWALGARARANGHPSRSPDYYARCTLSAVMTAKETLLQRAPHWSEEQAERALRAAENGAAVDEWGNLAVLHEHATAETMQRLAREERAAGHDPW